LKTSNTGSTATAMQALKMRFYAWHWRWFCLKVSEQVHSRIFRYQYI